MGRVGERVDAGSWVASNVTVWRKSVLSTALRTGFFAAIAAWILIQSSRRLNSSAANVAVNSSKTVKDTPPVLTFSNTWQTASFGDCLPSRIVGTR